MSGCASAIRGSLLIRTMRSRCNSAVTTESATGRDGEFRVRWIPAERLYGEPYHTMVPGYGTGTVNLLRLWGARAWQEFNFQFFDEGDYARAVRKRSIRRISPRCSIPMTTRPGSGAAAASAVLLCGVLATGHHQTIPHPQRRLGQFPGQGCDPAQRYSSCGGGSGADAPFGRRPPPPLDTCVGHHNSNICVNPTHATSRGLGEMAGGSPGGDFPRHLEIIEEINRRFLAEVRELFPGDTDRIVRMSIFEEHPVRQIRMAHLACVGSFSVNGVAELQTHLLREACLRDFAEMWPGRFNNKTNGVSPRRFMRLANPGLSDLITDAIGPEWLRDLDLLENLETLAEDASFGEQWRRVKRTNKERFARTVSEVAIDPESMFDVMVKRLHEYKRQLLKVMHIISLHNRIRANPGIEIQPRTFVFGAKAAPGYRMAKLIIKLINSVAETINENKEVAGRLQIVFVPNFNVSTGERIYPAADLSEQISMAGMEASGTGNMKLALNGALTIGTLDGANIEIRDRVGADNFFEFGLSAAEAIAVKEGGYDPRSYYEADEELRAVIDAIAAGRYSRGDQDLFAPIVDELLHHDQYLTMADYRSYADRQDDVDRAYGDVATWTRSSILNTARCGFFSSDRAIRQYCEEIWGVTPIPVSL